MNNQEVSWFLLNYIAPTAPRCNSAEFAIDKFNAATASQLDVFAPSFIEIEQHGGEVKRIERPLLFHYVFVRGSEETVKNLCSRANGFSFVLNHSGDYRYVKVTEAALDTFRTIARFYGNKIPCYATDEVELAEGDLVQVVDGDFPGLTGRYISRKGSRSGKIVIAVTQFLSAVVYDIKADYVRVLEFAKDSKRAYDQIEAFVPRLFKALRAYHGRTKLDASITAPLSVFCRRFDSLSIDNAKTDAKLQLLLMTASKILGDMNLYELVRSRFDRLCNNITNPWGKALTALLIGVTDGDMDMLLSGKLLIGERTERESKSQSQLREEYDYYLGATGLSSSVTKCPMIACAF